MNSKICRLAHIQISKQRSRKGIKQRDGRLLSSSHLDLETLLRWRVEVEEDSCAWRGLHWQSGARYVPMTGLIHIIVILVAVVWPGNEGSAPHLLCHLDGDHLQCSSKITNQDRRRLGFTPTGDIEDRIMTGGTVADLVPAGTFLTENQVLPPIFKKVIKIKRLVRKKINSLLVPPPPISESSTISTTQDPLSQLANQAKSKLAKRK